MSFRKWHTVVAIVGIAAAAGAAWTLQRARSPDGAAHGAASVAVATSPTGAAGASSAAGATGPVPVEVGRAEAMKIEEDAQAVGSLRARQGVMLRPEVSGRIARLGFTDGQPVRRGQVLVQLDDALQAAQLRQAKAQLSVARATQERNRGLLAQNFISQSAFEQSQASLEVADAQVALAQAQVQRLRILAPFDGVAGIRNVSVGDYVKDGADLIGIEDLSSMWVDFRLPERYLARLKPGQPVDMSVEAWPGRRFDARVEALDALVDADGRSVLVRARVGHPDAALKSGMFARVRIVLAVRPQAVVVPEEALVPMGTRQYLVKVNQHADGRLMSERIEARVGARITGKAEILDGVQPGDRVVTAGHARLMRGDAQALRIVEVGRTGPEAPVAKGTPQV